MSSNPCNYGTRITEVETETIKRQTWAAYGCSLVGRTIGF